MHKKNKGFTILEVVAVVIIISILASLGLPTYQNLLERSKAAEVYPIFKRVREGYLARVADGTIDPNTGKNTETGNTWIAGVVGMASDKGWALIFMDNPNADPSRYFAYTILILGPGQPRSQNQILAMRRTGLPPYSPYTPSYDLNRNIQMYLDTGDISKTSPY